jgi:ubiquinone/menaquinone biosynthesis C-methylase UbiE
MKTHPIFARVFTALSRREPEAFVEHRRKTVEGLSGRVVEVGAGAGANFRLYPTTVSEVVAVEPEPYLREQARKAAESAPVPIRVVDGTAENLPFDAESFDTGVASLVLCSVDDPARALAELYRVIRPGGELRFYEHVVSQRRGHARVQRAVDVVWPFLAGGCHTTRDTPAAIERAGFAIEKIKRFDMQPLWATYPIAPHAAGRARRP